MTDDGNLPPLGNPFADDHDERAAARSRSDDADEDAEDRVAREYDADAEALEARTGYIQRWQCYADVSKSESGWTREEFALTYVGGGNRGPMITLDCSCGGEGPYDSGICVHRYRREWLHRANRNELHPDDPEEWTLTWDEHKDKS